MASACCTSVLFASVFWRISDSSVIQEHGCNATQVIEGGTGVMEFFLTKDFNMSSDDVFANLRRRSDLDTDIIRCFRQHKDSAVECSSVNARYLTSSLVHNSITLSIPNVTREFEGTYTLHVYVNNKAEVPISCRLEVIAPTTPDGDAGGTIDDVVLIAAVAGSLGTLVVVLVVITCVCCLRKYQRSEKKKKKKKEKEQTFTLMPVPANKKRSEKAADTLLPQTTPSAASQAMGTSSPRLEVNHTPEQDEFRRRKGGTSEVERSEKAADRLLPQTNPSTASEVMGTSSPMIEVNHTPEQDEFRRRKGGTSEVESIDNDHFKTTASPPVPEAKRNSWKQKDLACQQWYFQNTTSQQAEKWLLAAENREGSFLVIDSNGKPGKFILKVKFNGEVKNRFVFDGQSGFWIESNSHFPTVTDLIDYYCDNAGCLPDKLSVPCSRVHKLDSLGIL